jgi:threonine aldolase
MTNVIDLRSDTVTKPTAEMSAAMATAVVGDDVFGDDPTVIELQTRAAELMGMEAALFVPTGTMGNLVAAMAHCTQRGAEMIVGNRQHMFLYEQGGVSALAGIHPCVLQNAPDGTLSLDEVAAAVRGDDPHYPITQMVTVENTNNSCGGVPLPTSYMDSLGALAKANGIKFHVDGARIFNAATALNTTPARLCQAADSVMFCLSKGLGCPAGSVVAGSKDFIARCLRARKALGGGMRQAGVLAAAGLIGLDVVSKTLSKDHALARRLAEGISAHPTVKLDPTSVHTNIVFMDFPAGGAVDLADRLEKQHGILVSVYSDTRLRAVLHHQIDQEQIDKVLECFAKEAAEAGQA